MQLGLGIGLGRGRRRSDPILGLPGLVLRLQTESRTGAHQGTFVTPGSDVGTWVDDLSESGVTATAVGGAEPTLEISNDKRTVSFSSAEMTVPQLQLTGLTFFAAFRATDVTGQGAFFNGGGTFRSFIQLDGSTNVQVRTESNVIATLALPQELTVNQWVVLEIVITGSSATVWVNGQEGGTGDVVGDETWVQRLGGWGGFNFLAAEVGALLFFEGALSDAQRATVRRALSYWRTLNYYVSDGGSDSNTGWSDAEPLATLAAAMDVGLYPGDTVNLARGSVWREELLPSWGWDESERITFRDYGTGDLPRILGSQAVSGPWTLSTGTEYTTPLAFDPRNAFWINGLVIDESTVEKLILGTAGALAVGGYAYSGGNLHVNIGANPTGQTIEVPRDGDYGVNITNTNGGALLNLSVIFAALEGITCNGSLNWEARACESNWNGEDGVATAGGADLDTIDCTIIRNGGIRTPSGGRGDGVSYHDVCTGVISGCVIRDNEKGGILNQEGCTVEVTGNFLKNNNQNAFILATADPSGTHDWSFNVIVVTAIDAQEGLRVDGAGNTVILNAVNNTIVAAAASGFGILGATLARNNIVQGFGAGLHTCASADHNDTFDCVTDYVSTTPGPGAIDADPLFVNPAADDYGLQGGSPCIGTGTAGLNIGAA